MGWLPWNFRGPTPTPPRCSGVTSTWRFEILNDRKIRNRKFSLESQYKIFEKIEKFSRKSFEIFDFFILIFQWKFLVSKKISKNIFSILFQDFFRFRKNIFLFEKNILKSKIWSGTQKSYLENYTSILKLFKIKNPLFLTLFPGFPYDSVRCYVHRPLKKEPSELGENWKTDIAGLVAKWLTKRHRHLIRQVLVSESVF